MHESQESLESLKKENKNLRQQLKKLEEEQEILRRQDAIDEMAIKAEARLLNKVKQVSAVGTAILAITGFATFSSLVNSVSQSVKEQGSKAVIDEAKERATEAVKVNVTESLRKDFQNDKEFKELIKNVLVDSLSKDQELRDKVTKDPALQDKITAVVEDTVRKRLLNTSEKASQTGNFAQAVEATYQQETYFVVSGSDTVENNLGGVLGKALSNGLNAQVCPPKKGNRRYALVVSDQPKLPLPYESALKVRDKARKTIQNDAYILSQQGTFFDCGRKSSMSQG